MFDIIVQQDATLFTVSYLEESVVMAFQYRTPIVGSHHVLPVGTVLITLLATRNVIAQQGAVLIEEQQVLTFPYVHVLQVQLRADGERLLPVGRLNEVLTTKPDFTLLVNEHIVDLPFHAQRGKETVHVRDERLCIQIDTRHIARPFQPQVMEAIIIQMVMSAVVRQQVFLLLISIDMREARTVIEVNISDGGNGHTSCFRTLEGLCRVVGQAVRGRNGTEDTIVLSTQTNDSQKQDNRIYESTHRALITNTAHKIKQKVFNLQIFY